MFRATTGYLLFTLLVLTSTDQPTYCDKDRFTCANGQCIPWEYKCNGYANCLDESDEGEICSCRRNSPNIFVCPGQPQGPAENEIFCIFQSQRCNGVNDCPFGEDELNCNPISREPSCQYMCHNGQCLYVRGQVCDGTVDCADNSDEFHCGTECKLDNDLFLCADNSSCLTLSMVCDGETNCKDGSDEGPSCFDQSCSTISCASNQCVQLPSGPVCHCGKNFYLVEDVVDRCEDVDECETYGICSQACVNTPGSYECACYPGYHIQPDYWTCISAASSSIVYTTGEGIYRFNLDTQQDTKIIDRLNEASLIFADQNSLYWTENQELCRLEQSSMFIERLPLGVGILAAVEWITGNVYFIDQHKKIIIACAGMTQRCHAVVWDGLERPQEITLDPKSGLMFWADNGQNPHIGMSYLDGHGRLRLVEDGLLSPNALAVDHEARRLYWADAGKLETILWSGGGRILLMHSPNSFLRFNLLVMGTNLYWLDSKERVLYSADKFSAEEHPPLPIGRHPRTMRTVLLTTTESVFNPCDHTLCAYFCLLAGNQSYTCANAPEVGVQESVITTLVPANDPITDLSGTMVIHVKSDREPKQSSSSSSIVPITISLFVIVMAVSAVLYHWALKPAHQLNRWTMSVTITSDTASAVKMELSLGAMQPEVWSVPSN